MEIVTIFEPKVVTISANHTIMRKFANFVRLYFQPDFGISLLLEGSFRELRFLSKIKNYSIMQIVHFVTCGELSYQRFDWLVLSRAHNCKNGARGNSKVCEVRVFIGLLADKTTILSSKKHSRLKLPHIKISDWNLARN